MNKIVYILLTITLLFFLLDKFVPLTECVTSDQCAGSPCVLNKCECTPVIFHPGFRCNPNPQPRVFTVIYLVAAGLLIVVAFSS